MDKKMNGSNFIMTESMQKRIDKIKNYQPKIGFFGKTGVGKSSLCNALFGQDLCPVNDIASCTRNVKEVVINMGKNSQITLLDVPGVGENSKRDEEYSELYQNLLPELDCVVWVLKADDRAFTSDELFYNNLVKPHMEQGKPFIVVLNQSDKIEPYREWNTQHNKPGEKQLENIKVKKQIVSKFFEISESSVIPVSASDNYNLSSIINTVVEMLPAEKLYTFVKNVNPEYITQEAKETVTKRTASYILTGASTGAMIGATVAGPIGAIVGGIIGGALGFIADLFSFW